MAITNLQVQGTNDSEGSVYSAKIFLHPRSGAKVDKDKLIESVRKTKGFKESSIEARVYLEELKDLNLK